MVKYVYNVLKFILKIKRKILIFKRVYKMILKNFFDK